MSAVVASAGPLPAFGFSRLWTEWEMAPMSIIVTVWASGLYLLGVLALRRRGDVWPIGRSIAWALGMAAFYLATSSGLAAYDTTLLSAHMGQHMILSMVVPLVLALGAPVTLALRTLPGTPRRWLLAVLHSRVARVLAFPPLAFTLYVLSPWALYFTGWYEASLRSVYVHEMMHLHLVAVGALFFSPIVGVDPLPGRVSHPFRLLLTMMTLPFHAFLGVTIMNRGQLLGGDYYPELHDTAMGGWLPDPHDDQVLAGGLLWSSGELVGLVVFGVLFAQWVRASMQEAKREDRRLDRLGARQRAQGARAQAEDEAGARGATPAE